MTRNFTPDKEALSQFLVEAMDLDVAVLYGPKSYEDALYFNQLPFEAVSSGHVMDQLRGLGVSVRAVVNTDPNLHAELATADVVFVNMHGRYGEDGSVQGLLDFLNKRFTGSGIFASALTSDKLRFKEFLAHRGFATPAARRLRRNTRAEIEVAATAVGLPAVFKLVDGGSSIGMHVAWTEDDIDRVAQAIEGGSHRDRAYFVERFIEGRDLTVAVLDLPTQTTVLPIMEIRSVHGAMNDERAKLASQRGEHVNEYTCPAALPGEVAARVQSTARAIYAEVGCAGLARLDFVLEGSTPYCLELNSIPGLQKGSYFLRCAQVAGLSDAEVLLAILHRALVMGVEPRDDLTAEALAGG